MKLLLATVAAVLLACVTPMQLEAQKGWKEYTVEDEFSFNYPSNWKLKERENRFTTTDASLVYGNNDVQMKFEGVGGSDYTLTTADDDTMLNAMKTIIENKNNGAVFESGLDKYVINNRTAPYAIGTYDVDTLFGGSLNMVDMITAVHVGDEVVLVQYLAEEKDFDKYLPKAEQVIKSILPVGSSQENTVSNPLN